MAKLTRDALQRAIAPRQVNTCAVKRVRDMLSADEQAVLDEALALPPSVLPARGVIALLRDEADVPDELLPSIHAVQQHRGGREACKCPR